MRERRRRCQRSDVGRHVELLLSPRELYLWRLVGSVQGLWRIGLQDGRCARLSGRGPGWAAGAMLGGALGRAASQAAVAALAADLEPAAGDLVALDDVDLRLWYLRWKLRER